MTTTTTDVIRDDATLGTPAHDDADMPKAWTEDDVLRLLWRHFASQGWCAVPQVTVSLRDLDPIAYHVSAQDTAHEETDRRIDMLLARRPRSQRNLGDLETIAIEVKVSRADFLNDVRNPEKQAPWRRAATRHAYAVPAGLVSADEIPEASGLLAVKSHGGHGWGTVEWVKPAPYRDGHAPQLPLRAQAAILQRITALEGHTRGWHTGPAAAGSPQELRAALAAAHKDAERANSRADRMEAQRDAWREAYGLATPDGHPCAHCGNPVKPLNPGPGGFKSWRHLDRDHDEPCTVAQEHAAEVDARRDYAQATEEARARAVREAHYGHRNRFNPAVEAEPWRAFLARWEPAPPEPAEALPEGAHP